VPNYVDMAKASCTARGFSYYGNLKSENLIHWSSFSNMHKRSIHISDEFSQTYLGFKNFIDYLGPVPENMIKPSLGRKDHSLGYIRGNFEWQSLSDNGKEAANRTENYKNLPRNTQNKKLKEYLQSLSKGTEIHLSDKFLSFVGYSSRKYLIDVIHHKIDCAENFKIGRERYIRII
jgi:hypothetical protein